MSDFFHASSLLPVGMEDILPHDALFARNINEKMMRCFLSFGYDYVCPPLAEYTEGLFSRKKIIDRSFRIMDPLSHQMLSIRPDITIQLTRIANSRLKDTPRPLRLCYEGPVLWVEGSHLEPRRQLNQLGLELIGVRDAKADIELVQIAAEALKAIGIEDISIDITCPPLAGEFIKDIPFSEYERQRLFEAFNEKDAAQITAFKDKLGSRTQELHALLTNIGDASKAYEVLKPLRYTQESARYIDEIGTIIEHLSLLLPQAQITLDPIENRGFSYYSGVSFSIYDRKNMNIVARGGRYRLPQSNEPASGLSFYSHHLLKSAIRPQMPKRIYIPADSPESLAQDYRQKGWITVRSFQSTKNIEKEAVSLHCDYYVEESILKKICYKDTPPLSPFTEEEDKVQKKERPIFRG